MNQPNLTAIMALNPDAHDFVEKLTSLYFFDTGVCLMTKRDIEDLVSCGSIADRKIGHFMAREEITALAGYLRAAARRRALTDRLLTALSEEVE